MYRKWNPMPLLVNSKREREPCTPEAALASCYMDHEPMGAVRVKRNVPT